MKKIILFLLFFCMFSCKKAAINEVDGLYNVTGEIVRCSYYYCDTTLINSVFWVRDRKDNSTISVSYFDSIINEYEKLGHLEFENMTPKEIIFTVSSQTSKLKIDKETNFLNYYRYINNDEQLEDTVSRYIRLEGYKQ